MNSLSPVRKKHPNYPVEFKIKMVELSYKPGVSVAQLAREQGINDNLLFKWRQYWREGKLRAPQQSDTNMPVLIPVTLNADTVPVVQPSSEAYEPETLSVTCEITFRHGTLRLNGAISESLLTMLIRELKQ